MWNFFKKVNKLGSYLYLIGPFFLFTGFYNQHEFLPLPIVSSLAGLMIIPLITIQLSSVDKYEINRIDILFLISMVFLFFTSLSSSYTEISLKRWLLIIGLGSFFYLPGRLALDPITDIKNSLHLCAFGVVIFLTFATLIFFSGCIFSGLDFPGWNTQSPNTINLFSDIHIGQKYGGRILGDILIFRPSSLYANPNSVGLFALIAYAFIWPKWNKRSLSYRFLIVLVIVLLIWTASRAAIVSTFLYTFSYHYFMTSKQNYLAETHKYFFRFGMICIFIIPIVSYVYAYAAPQANQWSNYFEIFQLRERGEGWRYALLALFSNLSLSGVGFGTAQEGILGPNNYVFSVWLILLLETGLIGFCLVMILFVYIFSKLTKSILNKHSSPELREGNIIVISLLIALLFHQSFDLSLFRLHPLNFLVFSLVGLAANPHFLSIKLK